MRNAYLWIRSRIFKIGYNRGSNEFAYESQAGFRIFYYLHLNFLNRLLDINNRGATAAT